MVNQNNNNHTIAIAKAIGIMLVVLWHADPPSWIGRLIMFFCVPLFFFTSGYFFKPKKMLKDLFDYILKRIRKLYFPFIYWSIPFLLLHNTFVKLHIYSQSYSQQEIIQRLIGIITKLAYQDPLVGPLWFVSVLFFVSISMVIVTFILEKGKRQYDISLLVMLIIIAILSKYYIDNYHYFRQVAMYSFAACFFISGHIFKNSNYNITGKTILCCLLFLSLATYYYDRVVEMVNYTYYDVVPYYLLAISGIVLTLFMAEKLQHTKFKHFLVYCGNHTMIILALHCLSFRLVSLLKIHVYGMSLYALSEHPVIGEYNQWFFILYFIVGIVIPLLIYSFYDTIKGKIKYGN